MRPVRQFGDEAPTIEVVAFRDGHEIGRELCDTPEEAAEAVEQWSDQQGVVCNVDDISVRHAPPDILDSLPEPVDEDRRTDAP